MLKMIKPAFVLFLTCLIVTGLLALTYSATKDTIEELEDKTQQDARECVLAEAAVFEEADSELFAAEPIVTNVYIGKDSSQKIVGAVVSVEPKGYGNKIKISVGIKIDGTIEAIEIVEHEETPGLGAKILEEPFISQFDDLDVDENIVVVKTGRKNKNEIEAISGATISSKAVTDGVNIAKKISIEILNKAGDGN